MTTQNTYRPRNSGNDYYEPGIYLVTLVVKGRQHALGELNMDARHPVVNLTDTGRMVMEMWQLLPEVQKEHGNNVKVLTQCAMPDHWHGVIEVEHRMEWSLGKIMQAFKAACSNQCRKPSDTIDNKPLSVDGQGNVKEEAYSLFEDNYDDIIHMSKGQAEAMMAFVKENPRRAIYQKLYPQFMQRRYHVEIAGRDYAAFGNLFLLRWANKEQVFCHRRDNNGVPYEQTTIFQQERNDWLRDAYDGLTVLVTPGISKGELQLKNDCLERGLPLIHLQKEPMPPLWKPDRKRYDACVKGRLLILSPWTLDQMDDVESPLHGVVPSNTDYSRFHNMNELAREICTFYGEAKLVTG